jgi:hypothetical protein
MAEPIIDDGTPNDVLFPTNKGRGLVPRDYNIDPPEMFSPPTDLTLIPKSEWSERIKDQATYKARLSDVRNIAADGRMMPNLDQARSNYCWSHSITHAVMLQRAVANEPYVPLSAYAVAATIMKGANDGGWCGLSAKFAREKGIPSQAVWPQGQFNYRAYDKPETWADAARHQVTEDFADLTRDVYDQNLTFTQLATCLLSGIPCAVDFNWWGHSVCAMDLVEVEPGSFGIRILNSWSNWGENGTGILRGGKEIPDGAIAVRVTPAAGV